jgi:hypothetical protein
MIDTACFFGKSAAMLDKHAEILAAAAGFSEASATYSYSQRRLSGHAVSQCDDTLVGSYHHRRLLRVSEQICG